jgi:hypothetical protein
MLKEIEIAHAAPLKAKAEMERIRKSGTAVPDAAPPPPSAEREKNKVYQTPKGPKRWNGTGWVEP